MFMTRRVLDGEVVKEVLLDCRQTVQTKSFPDILNYIVSFTNKNEKILNMKEVMDVTMTTVCSVQ